MTSRDYFKGKRVALIGLGHNGEMVEDARFLIKAGAILSVYDLQSEAKLKSYLVFLRGEGLANYVCGSIPEDDLVDMDLIILSHEYPRDSSFLKLAKKENIQIEYPETLFFRLAPPLTIVGVMGICGKTSLISMLRPMLEKVSDSVFTADHESGKGILSFLKKAKNGDILILKITDIIFNELREIRISPQVAIFTTVPQKGTYADSPFEILDFQTYNNFIIASDEIIDTTRLYRFQTKAKMLRTKPSLITEEFDFKGRAHDRENAALSFQAARLFKVPDDFIQEILSNWKPLKGRIELIKKIKGIEFYNDSASVNPASTIASIISLSLNRNVILILGGAESGFDYRELHAILPQYVHTVILIPGSGTMKERRTIERIDHIEVFSVPSVEEATILAREHARSGDKILFSPGFYANGIDPSRKDRGERFVKSVRGL